MSSLTTVQKTILESALGMGTGYVLDFSDVTFREFFIDVGIDIDSPTYGNGSKASRMRALWRIGSSDQISKVLRSLADYVDAKHSLGELPHVTDAQVTQIRRTAQDTAPVVESAPSAPVPITTGASVARNMISIEIHEDIYSHIERYILAEDYFHAVDEAYKVVREKLRDLTGQEAAHKVFNENAQNEKHYPALFGKAKPVNLAEADFFRGIGYLHLGVQFLRNEKAHTLATPIEPNLAIHYLALASLAYDLITKYVSDETVAEIEEAVHAQWRTYGSASAFYADFEGGKWLTSFARPPVLASAAVRKALKSKWLAAADFTRSWNRSNLVLMRLQLLVDDLTTDDIDHLLILPTEDKYRNNQLAGMDVFLKFVEEHDPTLISPQASAWLKEQQ